LASLILLIVRFKVDKIKVEAMIEVGTFLKINAGLSVYETLLPTMKLKGKQDSEMLEVARNATGTDPVERQVPVYCEYKLLRLPHK
jgi:hypothetical protein